MFRTTPAIVLNVLYVMAIFLRPNRFTANCSTGTRVTTMRGLRRASFPAPSEPDYVFFLGQAAARKERHKEAADAYERFLVIAPKTDADRRARIRGLIDFLRYLGQQNSLYDVSG